MTRPHPTTRRRRAARRVAAAASPAISLVALAVSAAAVSVLLAAPAAADPAASADPVGLAGSVLAAPQPTELNQVLDRLTGWLVGLLAALATMFATIGGLLYLTAGGDFHQIEKAKGALKSAAVGYALAALAPILVDALQSIVGG